MTPQRNRTDAATPYTPTSDDRRRARRDDDNGDEQGARRPWWASLIRPTEIAVLLSLLMGSLNMLGFHRDAPATAIAATASSIAAESIARVKADTVLTRSVDSLARRLDRSDSLNRTVNDRITFISYMICLQAKDGQTSLGTKDRKSCETIIQQRLAP